MDNTILLDVSLPYLVQMLYNRQHNCTLKRELVYSIIAVLSYFNIKGKLFLFIKKTKKASAYSLKEDYFDDFLGEGYTEQEIDDMINEHFSDKSIKDMIDSVLNINNYNFK